MASQFLIAAPLVKLFTDPKQFKSIFFGSIYIGGADKDPLDPSHQQQVYVADESNVRTPVSQPIPIGAGGYAEYNGHPAKFVCDDPYSIVVLDKSGAEKWRTPDIRSIDLSNADHNVLIGRDEIGAHDTIYRRESATLSELANGDYAAGSKLRFDELGGARFNVVSGGSPNGYDIRDAGNGNTAVLVVDGVFTSDGYEKIINPIHWGAEKSAVDSPIDCSDVFNHIADVYRVGGATFQLGGGKYYFASPVDLTTNNNDLGQAGFNLQGLSKGQTELFTNQSIDLFLHNDRFIVNSLTIAQRGTIGAGVAMRSNGQCRFCSFTDVEVWWFKYGNLQRFSLWNTYRDVYYVGNACGIKLARSDNMEDVTNPSPPGVWNAANGWFHNQNTFENITFNGGSAASKPNEGVGEVAFWGAIQGCNFSNITMQNYNRDGLQQNQIQEDGHSAMPLYVAGGGPGSSRTFNNQFEDLYFEANKNCITFEDCRQILIDGLFTQGQAGGEAFLTAINSVVSIRGYTAQTAGFTTRFDLSDSSKVYTDGAAVLSGASDTIDATSDYFETTVAYASPKLLAVSSITPETSGTINTDSTADQLSYCIIGNRVVGGGRIDIGSVSLPIGAYFEINGLPKPVANLNERAGNQACSATILGSQQTVCPAILLESSTSIRVYYDCSTLSIGDNIFVHFDYFW